jgi:glucose/arabinose dehydrogenase
MLSRRFKHTIVMHAPDALKAVTIAALLALGGCMGRTAVAKGPDAAEKLPLKPHQTPQQYPSPSELEAVQEPEPGQGKHRRGPATAPAATTQSALPPVPAPDPSAAQVPEGFRVEVVMQGLTYLTSIDFDAEGNLYIAEAGYSYGDPSPSPRIIRLTPKAEVAVLVEGEPLNGPINDLLWHEGRLYISHRGKISVLEGSRIRDLVTGLPSDGDHQNNQMAIGADGKLYFGQGTATNSGVVGIDNYKMGWLKDHPDFHDVPAKDLLLVGRAYETSNPLTAMQEQVKTSAFHPFAEAAPDGSSVSGQTKASGTILRMDQDGRNLEVYAWGFRNPYGLMWSDGTLYATENGFDVRGSRPIANDKEDIYIVKQGAWFGWPDFAMGKPVTDPQFKPEGKDAPQFLMKEHPMVVQPWMTFPKHSAITKLDVSPSETFGRGRLFVAFFGHMTPMTGKPPEEHGGHRVVAIDPKTKQTQTFFGKKGHGSGGHGADHGGGHHGGAQSGGGGAEDESITAGPRRLIDVRFAPDGQALYVVDFGSMVVQPHPRPIPGTGVIWRACSSRPPMTRRYISA